MFECSIIADSVNPAGKRITTFQITFPRIVLAEFNTHRMLSRNSASSRAIPVDRMIQMVESDPYIPIFTANQPGMQGEDKSNDCEFQSESAYVWLEARFEAINRATMLLNLGVHKQDVNRLLEPWLWHTVVVTATEWANFFALRVHPMAHPAIQHIATMMADLMESSTPKELRWGQWHLPYIGFDEVQNAKSFVSGSPPGTFPDGIYFLLPKMSAARCARVSYLRQNDLKSVEEDLALHDRLVGSDPKHASPTEHQAVASKDTVSSGNFRGGWYQYRQTILNDSATHFERNTLCIDD